MKLIDVIAEAHGNQENQTLHKTPAIGNTGDYVTTSQAAKILGVTASRIRQFISDGRLKALAPEKGRRDTLIRLPAVKRLKKELGDHKPGRKAKKKVFNESYAKLMASAEANWAKDEAWDLADHYKSLLLDDTEQYANAWLADEIKRRAEYLEISPEEFQTLVKTYLD